MKKYYIILLSVLLCFSSCMNKLEEYDNSPEGNFEALWNIIDTRYCYLDYKNINWDSIYYAYKAKLASTENDKYKLFDLFGEMLAELKDGHVNLYSDFDVSRYDKWYTDSAENYYSSIVYSDDYVGKKYRIAGGFRYGILKNANIGYIYYGSFSSGFSSRNVVNIFETFSECDGLIIDVRNNGGGSLVNAEQLASYFFTQQRLTGYMSYKNGNGHSDFSKPVELMTNPHPSIQWERPVAVLTNRNSYSATNDFVNRMNHADNGFTVGSWTGGGGGMPMSSELPNGWMVRFSSSPVFDVNMRNTENGIAPSHWIEITEEDKDNNRDVVIDKAVELIMSRY